MKEDLVTVTFTEPSPARGRPRLSIVIPVFKHSGLVREAMYSLARQHHFSDVDVVFVDDGCPDPQTLSTLTFFSARWRNVHYIRQVNNGLSAARNRGIQFTLRALPDAEGIYFLDADNFLATYSIAAMQEAILVHPEADWFYPDVRMFGLRLFNDYSGSFNAYAASVCNICEAGSLIRRRMIVSGLRFDEDMRHGYEDWDFWLCAIERGFRGKHLPALGLSYRKRAESMLADSTKSDSQIRDYMRRKHEGLYQINAFARLEHEELPRFAVLRSDEASVELATDLQLGGRTMSEQAFELRLWQSIREPTFVSAGQYLLTTTDRTTEFLRRGGLLRWLSVEIEGLLNSYNFVSLTLVPSQDNTIRVRRGLDFSPRSHLLAISHSLLQSIAVSEGEAWILALPTAGASYEVASLEVSVPENVVSSDAPKDLALSDFVRLCLHLRRNGMSNRPNNLVEDVFLGSRPLNSMLPRARAQFDNAMIPPIASAREGRIAFVLPVSDFGGVEKVTFCLARELRRLGFSTSLVLLGRDVIYRGDYAVESFDDIYIFDARDRVLPWAGASFFGTQLPKVLDAQWARDTSNFLATFELVVSCHSAEILPLLSGLRRRDVTTSSYLHLFDKSKIGGYFGHPTLALAYEHALDLVLTCSDTLAVEMASLGIPRTKLLSLPNAPSLVPAAEVNDGREAPSRADGPVRLLYLGRLDTQKGLDRLTAIFDAVEQDPSFEIRVIGKGVLSGDKAPLGRYQRLVEPPIYDDDCLSKIYRWADILLLPSRYEGLPLTILEAMAHGVVPIVADCGAVAEAIKTEVSGFVVPQERCAELFVEKIRELASDRERLRTMSQAATRQVASRSWSLLAERLRDRLKAIRQLRARTRADRSAVS